MKFYEKQVKILFLLTQDLESPGGLGRYFPLAKGLARIGHKVTIAALHGDFKSLQQMHFERSGVEVYYVGQMHVLKKDGEKLDFPARQLLALSFKATWALSRAALSIPADIVHIGKPHPMNSMAGLLSKYLKDRTLFLDCDDVEAASNRFSGAWQKWGVSWVERIMPRRVNHVTTHTTYISDQMRSHGIPAERISYLPNGVDPERFPAPDPGNLEALRSRLDLTGKKVVGYIGSLSLTNHPIDLLLKAFERVHQVLPGTVLLLVGGGADYQHLKAQTNEIGLEKAVRFCGHIPPEQVSLYYHLADVTVDPVNDDEVGRGRVPMKMFESWICGIPFVTADVGDRRMLIGDPPAGLIAQPGNADSLAEAILKAIENQELSANLRQQGLEQVRSYYWDRLAQKLDGIYRAQLEGLSS